jgi:hypothetical protein
MKIWSMIELNFTEYVVGTTYVVIIIRADVSNFEF